MFGFKWPWTKRRERLEREAAQQAEAAERRRVMAEARERSRQFIAEQQQAAAKSRAHVEQQRQDNRTWLARREAVADMAQQRQAHKVPVARPKPAPTPARTVDRRQQDGTPAPAGHIFYDEVWTSRALPDPLPDVPVPVAEDRSCRLYVDVSGSSGGGWSGSDSGGSGGSDSGGSSDCGGGSFD